MARLAMLRALGPWLFTAWLLVHPAVASAASCSAEQLAEILAPASGDDTSATIACDLHLTPSQSAAITRDLVFAGPRSSGVTLDCNGGTIGSADSPRRVVVVSQRIGSSPLEGLGIWAPVTDVTIRRCELYGSVRIRGMGSGAWDDEVTRSSHHPLGHVARVRAAAPRRITLEEVTLVGTGGIPLYVSPGVQDTALVRSYVTGKSDSVAIYLDAESRGAVVRDCTVDTATRRELIAIDGSEENRFINNWFSSLSEGGLYLYRNCGEREFVRMTPPRHNEIINNVFYYQRYGGPNPAVFFGADNGHSIHRFCEQDLDYPFGSGADDRDFATHNAVMQNQLYRGSLAQMLLTEWPETNTPNFLAHNEVVTSAVSRPSGCFVSEGGSPRFVPHDTTTTLAMDRDGRLFEAPVEATCTNGDLALASAPLLRAVQEISFECSVSGDNAGCRGEVRCPEGATLVGAHAACNLEYGPVGDEQLAHVPRDTIWVLRSSDIGLQGRCWIGERGGPGGEISTAGGVRGPSAQFGCREHDRNGGDCVIRGVAYCAPLR